ncbi:hypothetical protein [uncultured Duncaniella sp.]|uniref:hypothetical protein n=1 Tax=uncultured Duncaniella sp. TaxID=2768039 RepID=UPI0025A9C313|nr:hypothetical protein [uncultured Duncaniella sp.]
MSSKASATRTIKFITKSGTYTAMIMCPVGDLFQEYASQTAGTAILPSFEDTTSPYYRPEIYFLLTNSRSEGVVTPADMEYYIGDDRILFGSDGLSSGLQAGGTLDTSYAGVFKKITPGGGNIYHGLQILRNLPELTGWTSIVLNMVAVVNPPNSTVADRIRASYPIPISQKSGDSAKVTIASPDNFAITEKGGSCRLSAKVIKGGGIDTGWTFRWYQMEASSDGSSVTSGWIFKGTGDSFTVAEEDVQTSAMYRVEAEKNGEVISDMASVMDTSDPYDIEPYPIPEDETIDEDTTGNSQVIYTPKLVTRKNKSPVIGTQFLFILTDFAGNILNPATKDKPATSFTVTRADCAQGNDVSLTIIAI